MSHLDRITVDPEICHGQPTVRGLRYPVVNLLELLAAGMSIEEVLDAPTWSARTCSPPWSTEPCRPSEDASYRSTRREVPRRQSHVITGSPRRLLLVVTQDISSADLGSLEETASVLSDRESLARMAASDVELAAGQGEPAAQILAAMDARRGEHG